MDDKSIGAAVSQAIKDSGRTQADVASAVHMDTAALSRSLSGQRAFKFLELAWIADLVGTSVDGLIGRPQTLPFMAAARATSTADAHVNAEVSDIARLIYERRRGLHQLDVGSPSALPDISDCASDQAIADRIVAALNEAQGGPWVMTEVDEFASAIEKAFGVDVWVRPLPEGIDGYCVHAAADGVHGIVATSKVPAQRIRFTLAHELAHLVLGDDTTNEPHRVDLDGESGIERRANEIAGMILIPRARIPLRDEWSTQQIRGEAHRFRVAPSTFAARVRARKYQAELGTLAEAWPASTADTTYDAWQAQNCVERPPRRLLHDLAEAYTSGEATVRPFAQVAGIDDMEDARRRARALISQSAAA
ncbi:ImmA/IrrE family metallo-endopeptidase [Brachybacterium sp. JHP9]|uniref:ImmA/IrrE family metallo-endopeptidase n=1 Tax=Brachybacterium equifaecis TaxID=2910770 RepID=A0ABT0R619_9MICO|nr:ImmA/IrrE family metallo-endopeptidase [Brachybacterium equifaecis]MCL6424360.1 ImmA/IrrE family metallo-endopeptidase [Brachybacterium equifaecis]